MCTGERDGVTPLAAAEEMVGGMTPGVGRLGVLPGAGHFPWLDDGAAYFDVIRGFLSEVSPRA